jgi:hypothetical protein
MSGLTRRAFDLAEQILGRAARTRGILRQLARFTAATFGPTRDLFAGAAVTIEIARVQILPGDARTLPECARKPPDNERIRPDSARILRAGERKLAESARILPDYARMARASE